MGSGNSDAGTTDSIKFPTHFLVRVFQEDKLRRFTERNEADGKIISC
jgi:hypothetical protein